MTNVLTPAAPIRFECSACDEAVAIGQAADRATECPRCGRTYPWSDGILQLGQAGNPDDYPDEICELLASVEPEHFWFAERNRTIVSTMRRVIGPLAGLNALDIGCGTGFVTGGLEAVGMETCGLDMHLAALKCARRRIRGLLVCETAARIPFSNQFDVALLCDVIEHTPDDIAVLEQAKRAVKPGGGLIVTVPAHPSLWTAVDDASGHKRRYTEQMLRDALNRAGWRVWFVRHFNTLLFVAQFIGRRLVSRAAKSRQVDRIELLREALRVPPPLINGALRAASRTDPIFEPLSLRLGTSLIAVARRQPD